ncbi:MAG: rRNA maturation RNase YbeY [Planctomycetes bacterium]|nr:rRNA maturation RNase YbeY [Planctomycetota bacterium]
MARPPKKSRNPRPARVDLVWRVRRRPLTDREARRTVRAAAEHGGRAGAAWSVVFVSDRELAALHAQWLDDPSTTDVITFDLEGGAGPAGELYVSVDRAVAVSRARGGSVERELALYLVHGVLHLCGYDDRLPSARRRMRRAERRVLESLGHVDEGSTYF